ncbi:MAG: hypothetical protein IPI78_18735 [Chitinophagaceae bacterium]|nr:hypothetical protein [Chitinophagaceae bacterium]
MAEVLKSADMAQDSKKEVQESTGKKLIGKSKARNRKSEKYRLPKNQDEMKDKEKMEKELKIVKIEIGKQGEIKEFKKLHRRIGK